MRRSILKSLTLICVFIGCQSSLPIAHATEPVPERFATELQSLFKKYYPNATFTNRAANGICIEFEVTTFNYPSQNPAVKHENPVQRGPKKGGIACNVYFERGKYNGQLALMPRMAGQYQSTVIDKNDFKQLLAAPYSAKRDAHLWVSLSYPSDTSDIFMKELETLLTEFEKDTR